MLSAFIRSSIVGADGGGGTPVPIPNTAVKPTCAEDTWLEAARENKQVPTSAASGFSGGCTYSSLAQSVEHAAVNRRVVGSSPTGGAIHMYAYVDGEFSVGIGVYFLY